MGTIALNNNISPRETSISNIFLDNYMPKANGEFVKVYLCLLRFTTDKWISNDSISLSYMADYLNHTEGDVIRAIKYWEKEGLLSASYDNDTLTQITLLSPDSIVSEKETAASEENTATVPTERISYTSAQLERLTQDETIKDILFMAERLTGKTLTTVEMNILIYIHTELNFSMDLIEYLLDYCVTNEKKSIRYIEKVALGWHQEGITDVDSAKEQHKIYNKKVFSIMKSFGINDRTPAQSELDFMDKWYKDYGFDNEIILEACNRTIQAIHKPSFQYADSILANWKKQNVHTLADIVSADAARAKKDYAQAPAAKNNTTPQKNNRFNNFHQRDYDFDELEKKLLNKK